MKILVVVSAIPTQMNRNGAGVRTCVALNIADCVVVTFLIGICLFEVFDVGIDTCHVHIDLLHFSPDILPLGLSGSCFFLLRLLRVLALAGAPPPPTMRFASVVSAANVAVGRRAQTIITASSRLKILRKPWRFIMRYSPFPCRWVPDSKRPPYESAISPYT